MRKVSGFRTNREKVWQIPCVMSAGVPEHRLITRLGLAGFDVPAPMTEITSVKEVKLMLRQNIGAPCVPSVKVGDTVSVGQKIAAPPEGALGTCLHASIAGTVTAVTDNFVSIKA